MLHIVFTIILMNVMRPVLYRIIMHAQVTHSFSFSFHKGHPWPREMHRLCLIQITCLRWIIHHAEPQERYERRLVLCLLYHPTGCCLKQIPQARQISPARSVSFHQTPAEIKDGSQTDAVGWVLALWVDPWRRVIGLWRGDTRVNVCLCSVFTLFTQDYEEPEEKSFPSLLSCILHSHRQGVETYYSTREIISSWYNRVINHSILM